MKETIKKTEKSEQEYDMESDFESLDNEKTDLEAISH